MADNIGSIDETLTTNDLEFALYHLRVVAVGWENSHWWCSTKDSDAETTEYMRLRMEQAKGVVRRFEDAIRARGGDPSPDAVDRAIRIRKPSVS